MRDTPNRSASSRAPRIGFWLGAALFALFCLPTVGLVEAPAELSSAAMATAGVALLMACWWVTEAIPIPATSLLPLVAFPLLGVSPMATVSRAYGHPLLMLFLGGFMMALAIERWGLHRRLALMTISRVGLSPRRMVLGFMAATAVLSMWVSNTATTLMILPIALAVLSQVRDETPELAKKLGLVLLLGIAYGANIGGIGTPIGTPPNIVFLGIYQESFPEAAPITFVRWMMVGVPLVVVFLAIVWWYLVSVVGRLPRGEVRGARERIAAARAELGPASSPERRLALIFGLVAAAWIFRRSIPVGDLLTIPGWADLLGLSKVADDGTVAVAGALAMFLVPAGGEPPEVAGSAGSPARAPARLLDWKTAVQIPWGILILFGGGLALAGAFQSTGLSAYVGSLLGKLVTLPPVLLVLCVALGVTFLTEITSNTATTTILMPVLAATAVGTGTSPLVLMLTAALSASCAFMLPVATPPNAIVFSTERVPIASMARVGFAINLAGAALITALVTLWGLPVLGG